MAQDFEQLLKEVFGEPLSRLSQFQSEQMNRLMAKLNEIAREAVKDDLGRLQAEINDLRARVAELEAERVRASAEQV
jgi:polyhydroxyalkanoate synthesis regulator phasin